MIEGSSSADFASCDMVCGTHQDIEPPEPLDRGVDNLSAVVFFRDVGDERENPRFAAALPSLFCDRFDLGALARRSRDDSDSSLRKS
jgi:hypothetical protein